jgi:hypothetical protein
VEAAAAAAADDLLLEQQWLVQAGGLADRVAVYAAAALADAHLGLRAALLAALADADTAFLRLLELAVDACAFEAAKRARARSEIAGEWR